MTLEELKALGWDGDEALDDAWNEAMGHGAPDRSLSNMKSPDSDSAEYMRYCRWRDVARIRAGGAEHLTGLKPVGSFADDNPAAHAAMKNKDEP